MAKYRSRTNYADIYTSDKQGYNLGVDGSIYLKRETTPRVFEKPAIGTQGKSLGAVSASDDISAHATPATLKVTLGYPTGAGAQVTASIAVAGLTTGDLIAAALETAINSALAAAGQDGRVWVAFASGGPDQYTVWHQSTGDEATVVIANGTSNNIADDLNLGLANGGTETAGTDDADFFLYTTGSPTFEQPIESNQHRSGRFHTGIVRKKKVATFDLSTYVNMSGSAGDSIDNAVQLIIENCLGTKTVNAGVSIDFDQGLPNFYMSMVRVSTIFGEYYTGAYTREMELDFPGAAAATVKYTGKQSDCAIAGIGKTSSAVVASVTIPLEDGETERYTVGGRVMGVSTDGRTILYGVDGSIKVDAYDDTANTLTLNTAVSQPDDSYVVPWDPGAVGQTARDAIYTDLLGYAKLNAGASAVDLTSFKLSIKNDDTDLDNRFGADANKGRISGNRLTAEMSMGFDLSNETLGSVIRTRNFAGFAPEIVLGSTTSGRYLKITAPKWIPAVPQIPVPENGPTPMTLVGTLYQSAPGTKDPFRLSYR